MLGIWMLFATSLYAQNYAGFIDELRTATTDSLMNIDGVEYFLLYENYEDVHFLSLLNDRRERFIIGPAIPADTIYQNGDICARLGCEYLRRPLTSLKHDSMFVENKYPSLFERCETVSPCNFKALDSNNFGFKILVDYPCQTGTQWDFLRNWIVNYVDSFTNMDSFYYEDVYLSSNIDETTLPSAVLHRTHPEAFNLKDLSDGQTVVEYYRDMYMRQVYYLKNLDFYFPLNYLRIFITPRYLSERYVTLFISTNFYAYGAHDLPLERYITFDLKKQQRVTNELLFNSKDIIKVKELLKQVMRESGHDMGDNPLPEAAIMENGIVFSFQPYQIGSYDEGIFHYIIPRDLLQTFVPKDRRGMR
jgi:hypothetical protein